MGLFSPKRAKVPVPSPLKMIQPPPIISRTSAGSSSPSAEAEKQSQQELMQASQEKQAAIVEKINKAIKEVGVAGGYLYIFDVASGIPYISETLSTDVTGAVKAKLGIQ